LLAIHKFRDRGYRDRQRQGEEGREEGRVVTVAFSSSSPPSSFKQKGKMRAIDLVGLSLPPSLSPSHPYFLGSCFLASSWQFKRTNRGEGSAGGKEGGADTQKYYVLFIFSLHAQRTNMRSAGLVCLSLPPSLPLTPPALPPLLKSKMEGRGGGERDTNTQEKGEERGRVGKTAWVYFAPLLPSLLPLPLVSLNYTLGAKVRDRVDKTGIHEDWKGGKEGGRDLRTAQQARRRQRKGEEGVGRN